MPLVGDTQAPQACSTRAWHSTACLLAAAAAGAQGMQVTESYTGRSTSKCDSSTTSLWPRLKPVDHTTNKQAIGGVCET
jgi:hypothetical protein